MNYANKPNEFSCSIRTWTSYLPAGICYCFKAERQLACVAGVKRGRGRGSLGVRGRKERNACKDAIVFSICHPQILSVKIVIGQN